MSDQDLIGTTLTPSTTTPVEPTPPVPVHAPDLLANPVPVEPSIDAVTIKRLNDKDAFIETLKQEKAAEKALADQQLAAMQAQLDNVSNVSKIVEDLKTQQAPAKQVDMDTVVSEVEQRMQAAQVAKQAENNWETFVSTAVSVAGDRDKANAKLNEYIATNGLTAEYVTDTAKANPQYMLQLLQLNAPTELQATQQAPAGITPQAPGVTPPSQPTTTEQLTALLSAKRKELMDGV